MRDWLGRWGLMSCATLAVLGIAWSVGLFWGTLAVLASGTCVLQAIELRRFRHWARRPLAQSDRMTELWQEPVYQLTRMHRRARERHRRALERLRHTRSITEALPDAAVVTDADGAIADFNVAARELLGLETDDVTRNIAGLVRSPELIAMLRETEGEAGIVEFASPLTDGVWLEGRRIAVEDGIYLLLVRDITQLNRLLSMRQEFVANVSHELRTPLTVITGYVEALGEAGLTEDDRAELLRRLVSPTTRMEALVSDLLLLTRLESNPRPQEADLVPIRLQRLIQQAVDDIPGSALHDIEIHADANLRLRCVETEIHSAVTNLITNALRYSPNGGVVTVRWEPENDGARLTVDDQGIGIAAEHLERLTERFYRVDFARSRSRGGTGLGLAIVKHILNRHGGTLSVASEIGAGSSFTCHFPSELVANDIKPAQEAFVLPDSGPDIHPTIH